MRLLAVFFGIAAVVFFYLLARRLAGAAVALVASLIMVVAVPELDHSQEVRMYTMEVRAPNRPEAIVCTVRSLTPKGLPEWETRIKNIDAPTLLIWGDKDRTIPLELGKRLASDLPNATLSVIDGAGHLPNQERPEEVVERIDAFMRR